MEILCCYHIWLVSAIHFKRSANKHFPRFHLVPANLLTMGFVPLFAVLGVALYFTFVGGLYYSARNDLLPSGLIASIAGIGYDPTPFDPDLIGSTPTVASTCDEPVVGGASCTEDDECNSAATTIVRRGAVEQDLGNRCEFPNNATTTGKCVCSLNYAAESCTYKRYEKAAPGALSIALPFVGIAGVGSMMIERVGEGVVQLLMMLSVYCACITVCCTIAGAMSDNDKGVAVGIVCTYLCICCLVLVALSGMIWSIVIGAQILQGLIPDGNGYFPQDARCAPVNA